MVGTIYRFNKFISNMSSFSTNNNTRRTKRARVNGVLPDHTGNAIGSNAGKVFEHNVAVNVSGKKSGLVDTQIGSHNSKGLMIVGASANTDFSHPDNPDSRSILLGTSGSTNGLKDGYSNTHLAHPPFPISFSGPGYLAFQEEVALPFIRGDTHVTGNLIVDGTLTINNSGASTSFAPVITDALGNELDGAAVVTSVYVQETQIDYFECEITWTGFTLLGAGEKLRLTGFPLTNYSIGSVPILQAQGGVAICNVGGNFHVQCVAGQSYVLLEEVDVNAGTAPTGLTDNNLFGAAGHIHVSGWLRKT